MTYSRFDFSPLAIMAVCNDTDAIRAKTKALDEQTIALEEQTESLKVNSEKLKENNQALAGQLNTLRETSIQLQEKLDHLIEIKRLKSLIKDNQ